MMKLGLRHHVTALTLDRLDDHPGNILRRDEVNEDLMLEKVEALRLARFRLEPDRTAVAIAVIGVKHAALHRPKAFALKGLARRQRQRTQRPAMEAAEKRDHAVSLRGISCEFDRGFDRFRSGVGKE